MGTLPLLPEAAPRYLMGVGTPEDILDAVMLRCGLLRLCPPNTKRPKWNTFYLLGQDID